MNLVIPVGSASRFFPLEEYFYPKPLIEVLGRPMIAYVLDCLTQRTHFDNIVFIVREEDCIKYHLDATLRLISPIQPIIIKVRRDTQGALCSVLLAISHINNCNPLIISNADQFFALDVDFKIQSFLASNYDAACLTFDSVHPRWSYVRAAPTGEVVETAEKVPISRHAVAGLYMYQRGDEFVQLAMNSIRHESIVNGAYYIAPVFNEFILADKRVGHFSIPNDQYFTFYNAQSLKDFEIAMREML